MATALAAARATTKGKRMLRDALEAYAYGEEEHTLSEWNALKQQATRDGTWHWKASDASATLVAVRGRVEKHAATDTLYSKFATDLAAVMAAELPVAAGLTAHAEASRSVHDANQCGWRARIGGKQYACGNALPLAQASTSSTSSTSDPTRMCKWHTRACVCVDHPMEKSRVVEIANDHGFCVVCYAATAVHEARPWHQKTPPRLPWTTLPGVYHVHFKREVQRHVLVKGAGAKTATHAQRLTAQTVCAWRKEHSESAFLWQCRNPVVMHPTLRGACLPFCGYHAPRCVREYGSAAKARACAPIDRRNAFGLCRNHIEAQLSALPFEARAHVSRTFVDSEFDVPGVVECRRDRFQPTPTRHPLAPRDPPPLGAEEASAARCVDTVSDSHAVVVKPHSSTRFQRWRHQQWGATHVVVAAVARVVSAAISALVNHPNAASALLKEALWQLQFVRRAAVVATRIQRVFRGNRARRRVRAIRLELAALRRLRAALTLQRLARGYLGRLAFAHETQAVRVAVPTIQRVMRGALARHQCRRLRATQRIQCAFRASRQRRLACAMRDDMAWMRALQRAADANYEQMLLQVAAFRRLRARRVLRAHVATWRRRQQEHARVSAARLLALLSCVQIQRAFRRHQHYRRLQRRYTSAQQIQKRVRGWLTRHMWTHDPGVQWTTRLVSARSGFVYGKRVVLALRSHSYAFPSRVVRMQAAAGAIQRVYRGFMGRLRANMRWVAMLQRWEWLDLHGAAATDSCARGHERYGFLLPSSSYHHDPKRHMLLPIQRRLKADRGFAYKYQTILELLQDRDGKRAWSVAKEQQWTRRDSCGPPTRHPEPGSRRGAAQHERVAHSMGVPFAQALYPVRCLVLVASLNRRDHRRFHPARVVAVHSDSARHSHAATFDVEYVESVVSLRGVRVYSERNVPVARLRPLGQNTILDDAATRRRCPLGQLIQSAIAPLKTESQASRVERCASTTLARNAVQESERAALASVDAIADALRNENPSTDLLQDQRDLVNFVFHNSKTLGVQWLQVVDHVRYGTRDAPHTWQPTLRPMPERARAIEQRMAALGCQYEPSANIKDDEPATATTTTTTTGQRPHTTALVPWDATHESVSAPTLQAKDDVALHALAATAAAPDLHRLIYELKTLPRERHREPIVEMATRHARSFVCGVAACGRCFSSHEAARLHQQDVHLHQRRLAMATPLVDQYLHAYWPPQSPWNQELHRAFTPSVGYFRCTHADCHGRGSDGQFRTRRELRHHVAQVHRVPNSTSSSMSSGNNNPETSTVGAARATHSVRTASSISSSSSLSSSVVWLGAYSLCRANLEARLEGFPKTARWHGSDAVQCETHRRTPADCERCRACFVQSRRLVLPCRLYRAVALPVSPCSRHPEHREDGAVGDDSYVILSVDDPLLCPVVRERDLVALDEDDAQRHKRLVRQQQLRSIATTGFSNRAAIESLVFLRLQALCRDANSVDWAIGTVFRSVAQPQLVEQSPSRSESSSSSLSSSFSLAAMSSYEVVLDASHVVAVALADVRATCVVHRCKQTVFQRKYFHADSATDRTQMAAPRRPQQHPHRLCGTLTRYWKQDNATVIDGE